MSELDDVFATLQPPAGGLASLRARLERDRRRRKLWFRIGAGGVVAAAAAAVLIVFLTQDVDTDRGATVAERWVETADPALVHLGIGAAPADGVRIAPGGQYSVALQPMSDESDEVVYYRVATLHIAEATIDDDTEPEPVAP